MHRITVNTGKSYDIVIDSDFGGLAEQFSLYGGVSAFIITDENVLPIFGKRLQEIANYGFEKTFILPVKPGEASKGFETLTEIYNFLLKNGADRSSVLIALGGGVIGDLTGFAAATYMRGIRYVQIPTTLLAQVDSSVGGKTAVDFAGYKNIIGAFYQPDLVYINIETLRTLSAREFSAGMAEAVKYGLIMDADFFRYIEENIKNIRETDILTFIVSKCVEFKARIVEKDERDNGIREILNFGHTFGHAAEALSEFKLLHGECVALGMLAAMELSYKRGGVSRADIEAYISLITALNLPTRVDLNTSELYAAMLKDKKAKSGEITYILLDELGRARGAKDVTRKEAIEALSVISKGE